MDRRELGVWGEEQAVLALKKKGYIILYTNFRTRAGEIDIIANDKGVIVFIEVKTRTSNTFGLPRESVNSRKIHRIAKAALYYLEKTRQHDRDYRFDMIEVYAPADGEIEINHIEDAFHPDSSGYYF